MTRRLLAPLVVGAAFVVAGVRYVFVAHAFAVDLVFWDQWDFLDGLFRNAGLWTLFAWPHGPIREGLAGIVYAALYPLTDWSARVEALVAAGLLVASTALALVLRRRLFGPLRPFDAFIPFVFLSLGSFELLLGAQNLANGPLPIFLIVSAALTLTQPHSWKRAALLSSLIFVSLFTGFGLFAGGILLSILALQLRQRDHRLATLGAVVAGVGSLALFLRGYQPNAAVAGYRFPAAGVLAHIQFAGVMLGRAFGVGFPGTHPLDGFKTIVNEVACLALLLGLVLTTAVALRRFALDRREPVVLFLAATSLAFVTFTAVGRVGLGLTGALASRYTVYAVPGMLAIAFRTEMMESGRVRSAIRALLLSLLLLREMRPQLDLAGISFLHERKSAWVACFREAGSVSVCDARTGFSVHPEPERTRLAEKLLYLRERRLSLFRSSP